MSNWSSNLSQLAHQMLLDNSAGAWLYAALAFLFIFTVLPVVRGYLRARRQRYADRDLPLAVALVAHLADHTSRVVLWIVALYAADRILTLPGSVDQALHVAIVVGAWLQIGIWTAAAARFALHRRETRNGDARLSGTMDVVLFVLGLVIWMVVALLAMENLGINVGPLIAGLGVGGIAIALAVQAILGDLFASLSIALDKPFVIGDTLRVDTLRRHGGADRHQEHAPAQHHRRADHHRQRRPAEEPGAKPGTRQRAARVVHAQCVVRHARRRSWSWCRSWWRTRSLPIRARASCTACCASWGNRRCCSRCASSSRTRRTRTLPAALDQVNRQRAAVVRSQRHRFRLSDTHPVAARSVRRSAGTIERQRPGPRRLRLQVS